MQPLHGFLFDPAEGTASGGFGTRRTLAVAGGWNTRGHGLLCLHVCGRWQETGRGRRADSPVQSSGIARRPPLKQGGKGRVWPERASAKELLVAVFFACSVMRKRKGREKGARGGLWPSPDMCDALRTHRKGCTKGEAGICEVLRSTQSVKTAG